MADNDQAILAAAAHAQAAHLIADTTLALLVKKGIITPAEAIMPLLGAIVSIADAGGDAAEPAPAAQLAVMLLRSLVERLGAPDAAPHDPLAPALRPN